MTNEEENIGGIRVNDEPIMPGSGVNRVHDGIGDFSIKGCVAPVGFDFDLIATQTVGRFAMSYYKG